eukprot:4507_1
MFKPTFIQSALSIIGPIFLFISMSICRMLQKPVLSFSEMMTQDISMLGVPENKRDFYIREVHQLVFMMCFVLIGIMMIISGTARCITMEKLYTIYAPHKSHDHIRICNLFFILGSSFIASMSWIPCQKTVGHFISAVVGISFIIFAQILDAFNWLTIHSIAAACAQSSLKLCTKSEFLFTFPLTAMVCFIAWRPLYVSSIFEWFGVLFILFTFMVYGVQATLVSPLIENRSDLCMQQVTNSSMTTITIDTEECTARNTGKESTE